MHHEFVFHLSVAQTDRIKEYDHGNKLSTLIIYKCQISDSCSLHEHIALDKVQCR
jgi:hypothetical protein